MRTRYVAVVVMVALGLTLVAQGADKPSVILKPVIKYIELWTGGKTCEGIETCWDVDATFKELFGDDYTNLSDSDRSYCRHLFIVFMTAANRIPAVAEGLKDAKPGWRDINLSRPGHAVVNAVLKVGEEERPFHMVLLKEEAGYKIINMGAGDQDLEALKPFWEQFKKVNGKDSLPDYWEGMLAGLLAKRHPKALDK